MMYSCIEINEKWKLKFAEVMNEKEKKRRWKKKIIVKKETEMFINSSVQVWAQMRDIDQSKKKSKHVT